MDSRCPILFSGLSSATIFYLMLKLSLIWPVETPSNRLGPPSMFPSSFEPFLAVCCNKMVQVHVLLSLPQPQTERAVSTRSPGSWKLNQLHRSQDLSAKQAYGYWGVPASRPICIPTHTYSLTTIFISISTYANCTGVHPGTFPSNPTPQGSFWPLPFHFPNCVKPGFYHPYIFTYLIGTPT